MFSCNVVSRLACVASVSNRVIARKLERKVEEGEVGGGGRRGSFFPLPLPRQSSFFFALVPTFLTNSRGNACYAGYLQTGHIRSH